MTTSGFANTDLDLQLKKHGIHQLIVIGLMAHTCVEATVRYAAELGYEVTVVKDVTADFSEVEMHAALDVNIPNYAAAVVATAELIDALSSHADNGPAKLICSSTKCRHQSQQTDECHKPDGARLRRRRLAGHHRCCRPAQRPRPHKTALHGFWLAKFVDASIRHAAHEFPALQFLLGRLPKRNRLSGRWQFDDGCLG